MPPTTDQSGLFTDNAFLDFDSDTFAGAGTSLEDTQIPDLPFLDPNIQLQPSQYAYNLGQNVNPQTVAVKPDLQQRRVPRLQGLTQQRYATQQSHLGPNPEQNHDAAYADHQGTSINLRHVAQQKSLPASSQHGAMSRSNNTQQPTGLSSLGTHQGRLNGQFSADHGASRSAYRPAQKLGLNGGPGKGYKVMPLYSDLQHMKTRLEAQEIELRQLRATVTELTARQEGLMDVLSEKVNDHHEMLSEMHDNLVRMGGLEEEAH